MNKRARIIIAIYVLMGIATFGHAFRNVHPHFQDMKPNEALVPASAGAFAAAALWPLYWSCQVYGTTPDAKGAE